jgi:hypothetical protein
VGKASEEAGTLDDAALRRALARQTDGDDHDAGLIVERLAWTPEQRLEANAEFLRLYYAIRPAGLVIRED